MSTVYEYKTGQFVSYPIDSYANDGVDSYANEVIERFGYDDPSLPGKLHNVIFRFNNKDLRTYSWNPSSIEPFIEIDYGLNSLALTPTAFVDGGSVRDTEAVEVDDWGRIIYADTNFPFGTLRPVSNTTWTVVHAWVGTGTVFERGDTYYRLVAPYIVTGTLHVTGNTVTHWVPTSRPMVSLASSRLRILHSPSKNLEVEIYSILVMDSPFVAEHTKRKELLKLVEMQMLHSNLTGSVVVLSKLMVLHLYLEPSDTKLLELYQHSTVRTKEELIRTTHLLLYHSGIWIWNYSTPDIPAYYKQPDTIGSQF